MKQTFRTLLVASAVVVSAASLAAAGVDTRQQTQPPQSPPSSQSGQSAQPTEPQSSQPQPSAQGRDEAGARQELVQAKQALMDLTKLPEASQLQGEARNGVIQIINAFNGLVTADANWLDRYKEVQQQVTRLLGDASASSVSGSEPGSTGTSGSASASPEVPAAVRTKLIEFRQHLTAFGKAAGAPDNGAAAGTSSSAASSSSSSTASDVTSSSAQSSQSPTSSQAGTTSSQSPQSATSTPASGETFQQHFDAIADLVQQALASSPAPSSSSTTGTTGTSGSTTGSGSSTTAGSSTTSGTGQSGAASATSSSGAVPVDRATLEQIQSHLQRLRELARQRGIQ
jgi:hypothetical protein